MFNDNKMGSGVGGGGGGGAWKYVMSGNIV